jgi:hypothetical protein
VALEVVRSPYPNCLYGYRFYRRGHSEMEFRSTVLAWYSMKSEFLCTLSICGLKIRVRVTGVRVRVPLALPHEVK